MNLRITEGYGELRYFRNDIKVLTSGACSFSQLHASHYDTSSSSRIPLEELSTDDAPYDIYKLHCAACEGPQPLFVTDRPPCPGDMVLTFSTTYKRVRCYLLVTEDTFRPGINRHYKLHGTPAKEHPLMLLQLGELKGFCK